MAFDSLTAFIAMGTHGPYVWSAYGMTAIIVVWNVMQPLIRRKQLLREQSAALRRAVGNEEFQD